MYICTSIWLVGWGVKIAQWQQSKRGRFYWTSSSALASVKILCFIASHQPFAKWLLRSWHVWKIMCIHVCINTYILMATLTKQLWIYPEVNRSGSIELEMLCNFILLPLGFSFLLPITKTTSIPNLNNYENYVLKFSSGPWAGRMLELFTLKAK